MSSLKNKIGIILGASYLAAGAALAAGNRLVDSASLDIGSGTKVSMVRLSVQSDWDKQWFVSDGHHVGGYWDVSASAWHGTAYRNVPGQTQNLAVVGLTPVLRYERDDRLGWYAEAGIGANLFSELYNNADNRLSTAFQFGDHLGVGYVSADRWDIALKLQHYSNASIKRPNSGVNFLVASLRYRF